MNRLYNMDYLALKGYIRRIHPDAGDILPHMPSNSRDPSDKAEAVENLMAFMHPNFDWYQHNEVGYDPYVEPNPMESADPYGGSMISPYDDEPSDEEMDEAYDEAQYYIETEKVDGNDPAAISDLKHDTLGYLEMIGKGDLVSDESIDQLIRQSYPESEMDSLKTDLTKNPLVKAQFDDQPKEVIDRYRKRDT